MNLINSFKFTKTYFLLIILIKIFGLCKVALSYDGSSSINLWLRPSIRMSGIPMKTVSGEHISLNFYYNAEKADLTKNKLQYFLQNFLENLQKNLTTSSVLSTILNTIDKENTKQQMEKLNYLSKFFEIAAKYANNFAIAAENFFEATKNESNLLLTKLRHIPSAPGTLSVSQKMDLTNYFTEMEFFHVLFSEIIDEALEYIVDTLRFTQQVFVRYSDIQRDVLDNWHFKEDEWCCNRYMEFLQQWSAHIFQCAAGNEFNVAYDVFAISEITIKYILRQLEFRIQRLYNCFLFGKYEIRCRFLREAEQDFEKLFAKLDELEMYYDIKTKRGRITSYRNRRRRDENQENDLEMVTTESYGIVDKCIPGGFPGAQMINNLNFCFYV